MKDLTIQEMADHDGGRLLCIVLGIAIGAGAVAIIASGGLAGVAGGVAGEAGAVGAFIAAGC